MSMYECDNCGTQESTFPKIFMAVNSTDSVFPYHNTEFEEKFNELSAEGTKGGWKLFWEWLGENHIRWFCCAECATAYIKHPEEPQEITMIASGYEWTCPKCDLLHPEIETQNSVECTRCHTEYKVSEVYHANS